MRTFIPWAVVLLAATAGKSLSSPGVLTVYVAVCLPVMRNIVMAQFPEISLRDQSIIFIKHHRIFPPYAAGCRPLPSLPGQGRAQAAACH